MRKIDLTGKRFGRLFVICQSVERGNRGQIKWDCICDCGNKKTITGDILNAGDSNSCGCLVKENKFNLSHGMSKSRIYRIYRHMINRCVNTNVDSYPNYGGRGISVCNEWSTFEPFYEWAMKNGYSDKLTIDRKDNEQGYFPDNCQWSTTQAQARNKRNTICSMEIAREIRMLRKNGVKNKDVAVMYRMTRTAISEITHLRTWKE